MVMSPSDPLLPPGLAAYRRRAHRACDKCNESRTRCSGDRPCRRCLDYGHSCVYNREAKKRGRKPLASRRLSPHSSHSLPSPTRSRESDRAALPPPPPPHHHPTLPTPDHDELPPSLPQLASPVESRYPLPPPLPLQTPQVQPSLLYPESPSFVVPPAVADPPRGSVAEPLCRYRCLDPLLPALQHLIAPSVACDLLDIFFKKPGTSLFHFASPYVITHVVRRKALLHPTQPRPTSPALLATMLWCAAQTADVGPFYVPGSRAKIIDGLFSLSMSLLRQRDVDDWYRVHGGWRLIDDCVMDPDHIQWAASHRTFPERPSVNVDDVFTLILLTIVISGGDFKADCLKWWSKTTRLVKLLRLNCLDRGWPDCPDDSGQQEFASLEAQEEERRAFWLTYCLDRHLALSFNSPLHIYDSECHVFTPLPERVWENLEAFAPETLPPRSLGPPLIISGAGFFEYFLPLMAILGDIIDFHHRQSHPRMAACDYSQPLGIIEDMLLHCEHSLTTLPLLDAAAATASPHCSSSSPHEYELSHLDSNNPGSSSNGGASATARAHRSSIGSSMDLSDRGIQLVIAYSTHILHVLHVLLHGKWDAMSMLEENDDWITSPRFMKCASHAIAAAQSLAHILTFDPELAFMPYLFGIYMLHGSFILLLFADRMPQLGPNESVEQACEIIIRAHEACVVTLSTDFQKTFRKALRSTLLSFQGTNPSVDFSKARRTVLSVYRWTRGDRGLAL